MKKTNRKRKQLTRKMGRVERLESRFMLSANWRNPADILDVNADGNVSPIDALVVINYLNRGNSSTLPLIRPEDSPFVDIDANGNVDPIDALRVINYLNRFGNNANTLAANRGSIDVYRDIQIATGLEGSGAQLYRMQIDAQLKSSSDSRISPDIFSVYLLDPSNPSETLLDRSQQGTSIFTLYPDGQTEFAAGLVRWDGNILEVDLSGVETTDKAVLRAQLLQSRPNSGSVVQLRPLSNEVSEELVPGNLIASQSVALPVSTEQIDFESLSLAEDISVISENPRFDPISGTYRASLSLRNLGNENAGRDIALVIPGLPIEVSVVNASGFTTSGLPYVNFRTAIPNGGLSRNSYSEKVELIIDSRVRRPFELDPQVYVGAENRAPTISPLDPQVVSPGQTLSLPIVATDPEGDSLTYFVAVAEAGVSLPSMILDAGSGDLTFRPTPTQIGTYQVQVSVSDGALTTSQVFELTVSSPTTNDTIITGRVLDVDQSPIAGVPIELGAVQTLTQSDGRFELNFGTGIVASDTLRIRGELYVQPERPEVKYPFIAEKLSFMFGRPIYAGFQNELDRPIYLPKLNTGSPINPAVDTTIEATLREGNAPVQVDIVAGSLLTQQGAPFTGNLSITEVPVDRTPAALPPNLLPDFLVTIQPGEMVFTTPAPVTFPNTAGWAPGTPMDLWSINPTTGEFENVGEMEVSGDGTTIDTTSGGIRNSSWHFGAPIPDDPTLLDDILANQKTCDCPTGEGVATVDLTSSVELHSGALREWHALPSYTSAGMTHQVVLRYNSEAADPRPIITFGYAGITEVANRFLQAQLSITTNNLEIITSGQSDTNGWLSWQIPDNAVQVQAAIQANLQDLPTGMYNYSLTTALPISSNGVVSGSAANQQSSVIIRNERQSPFGAGWTLQGVQKLFPQENGQILLTDGDGTTLVYSPDPETPGTYQSPRADFATLVQHSNGTYTRTTPSQAEYLFDQEGRLVSQRDRNGRTMAFSYNASGLLSEITDPAGLKTIFTYQQERVASITDPMGRVTQLLVDSNNNLVEIRQPDNSRRSFQYDAQHRLTAEINENGFIEEILYGLHGRVESAVLRDGTTKTVFPLQTRTFEEISLESSNSESLFASGLPPTNRATIVDSSGNLVSYNLDNLGQGGNSQDPVGSRGISIRNDQNLVTQTISANQNATSYQYDNQGNIVQMKHGLAFGQNNIDYLYPGENLTIALGGLKVTTADFNNDGIADLATASISGGPSGNSDLISVLLGETSGGFKPAQFFGAAGVTPRAIAAGDFNGDGFQDLVTINQGPLGSNSPTLTIFTNDGLGGFELLHLIPLTAAVGTIAIADIDNDRRDDILLIDNGQVVAYTNVGNATLANPLVIPVSGRPGSLAVADMNNNGEKDLVVTTSDPTAVHLLLGSGQASFALHSSRPLTGIANQIVPADFDQDGIIDIALATSDTKQIILLNGTIDGPLEESFSIDLDHTIWTISASDMNNDGFPDLLVSQNTLSLAPSSTLYFENDGFGGLDRRSSFDFLGTDFTTADFNRDGNLDLAIIETLDGITINYGAGDGSLHVRKAFNIDVEPYDIAVADLDGDGNLDIVTIDPFFTNSVTVIFGDGQGGTKSSERLTGGTGGWDAVAIFDHDLDGNLDIVVGNRLFRGNGSGAFSAPVEITENIVLPKNTAAADFNNDGLLDSVTIVLGRPVDSIAVRLRNPNGSLGEPKLYPTGIGSEALVVADFNGDGLLDIAVANKRSNDVTIYLGASNAAFVKSDAVPVGNEPIGTPIAVLAFDINLDGILDIVTLNHGMIWIALGNGEGQFVSGRRFTADPGSSFAVGDFNGNGLPDILVAAFGSKRISMLSNLGDPEGNATGTISFSYDPLFQQLASVTDELGRVFEHEIDPFTGNRLSKTILGSPGGPNGPTDSFLLESYSYSDFGLIDTHTDALGRVTDQDYDPLGRMTTITFALGTSDQGTVLFEYDNAGNRTSVTDENGNRTAFEYDVMNRLRKITEPDPDGDGPFQSPVTIFEYDLRGNLVETIDAGGARTTMQYDRMDRAILVRDGKDQETQFTYDSIGNLISATDPNGNTTRHTYDARRRRISTTDPDGGIIRFRYDADDNLTSLTDPVGNATRFVYDSRNRLVREIDPLGNAIAYAYDAVDNLIRKVDRNGRTTHMNYDDLNRLVMERWEDADGTTSNEIVYSYDKVGNLLSVVDAYSSLSFDYDARDRVFLVDNSGTPNAPEVILTYTYDALGNITTVEDDVDGGSLTAYQYDTLNRMTRIEQSGVNINDKRVDLFYNQLGQFSAIDRFSDLLGNSLVARTRYTYDEIHRLTSLEHGSRLNSRDLAFYDYEYDEASRITAITDIDGRTEYGYDDRDQLTGADRGATDLRGDETYVYDANGNRISSQTHGSGYVTGAGNRLLSDGTYNYSYDNEGNMIRRTEISSGNYREFGYDHRNRMNRVLDYLPNGSLVQEVEFTYDVFGRRIGKSVDSDGAGPAVTQTTHFVYERDHVLMDFVDVDGTGTTHQPVQSVRYLFGPGVDQVLAQQIVATGETQWLLGDHLGTIRDVVADARTVLNHLQYDSFGHLIFESNPLVESRYQFTGREFDEDVGLHYYRARFYDAVIGRFISEDIIRFPDAGSNFFGYVNNSPLLYTDSSGTTPKLAPLVWLYKYCTKGYANRKFCTEIANEIVGHLIGAGPSNPSQPEVAQTGMQDYERELFAELAGLNIDIAAERRRLDEELLRDLSDIDQLCAPSQSLDIGSRKPSPLERRPSPPLEPVEFDSRGNLSPFKYPARKR